MGVGFFDCAVCERSVCDCGPYTSCEACNNRFCKDCHSGHYDEDGEYLEFAYAWGDKVLTEEDLENNRKYKESCPVCSKNIVLDNDLVYFLLERFQLTREEAEELYRNENT